MVKKKEKKETNDCTTCNKHIGETWNRWYLTFYDSENNETQKVLCEPCFDKELHRRDVAEAKEKKKKINNMTLIPFL